MHLVKLAKIKSVQNALYDTSACPEDNFCFGPASLDSGLQTTFV